MTYINHFIHGIPYSRMKTRGNISAPQAWTEAIIESTKHLHKVQEACALKVTFLLPNDKFPKDFPFGPDLDNLLKRLLDALNKTVFSEAKGHDSCVVILNVMKVKAPSESQVGAHIEVLPVSVT
jgi:Holliday junction resolvase RusA-like endonuclease